MPNNQSLPHNMHIRFLEIIQNDLENLIRDDGKPLFGANLRTLRGLISSLALAYSDQDCPDFMAQLTMLQQQLNICMTDKNGLASLKSMMGYVYNQLNLLYEQVGDGLLNIPDQVTS